MNARLISGAAFDAATLAQGTALIDQLAKAGWTPLELFALACALDANDSHTDALIRAEEDDEPTTPGAQLRSQLDNIACDDLVASDARCWLSVMTGLDVDTIIEQEG